MVDLNIVNYVRKLLQSGYDINSIKNQLVSSGYDSNTVNEAVNYVYQQPAAEAPAAAAKPSFISHFASRKFLLGIAAVVMVIVVSLVLITLLGGEPTPVEIYLTPSTTQVVQGEDLAFTKSFANIEGSGMLSISYSVVDETTGISVASFQESLSTQALKRSTQVSIPEETSPGGYILKATMQYAGQEAEKSFFFTVVSKQEEVEEEPEIPEEPQAGGPDNDNDGIPDAEDTDDDNDGIMDEEDSYPLDHDNDGTPDRRDDDSDNDGILNKYDDYPYDIDNDGIADLEDTDNDNDGMPDVDDVYPFDYDDDGVQDKDDDETGRSYSFPSAQSEAEFELTCSNAIDCNDFDICTMDRCMQGTCEHERQTPCCGNFICESGESAAGCPEDCTAAEEPEEIEDELIQEIMQVAGTNVESAAARCEQIETASTSSECFNQLAQKTGNKVFCERVYTNRIQNSCYLYFAMQGDSSDCPKIEDRLLRNSCYALANMAELQQ